MASSARKRESKIIRASSTTEKLDEVFNNFVDGMKPFVLKLAKKTERQQIAAWIKKLCEPPGTSLLSRKNRNMYAQVLLAMLKRDLIEEPFSQHPESGPLPTMPAYMSIYADDPTVQSSLSEREVEDSDTPSWITGELEHAADSYRDDSQHERNHSRKSSSNKRTPTYQIQGDENSSASSFTGSSTIRSHSSDGENSELSHSRSPYQAKRSSTVGKVRYEPVYLREILNSDLGYPTSTPNKAAPKINGEHSSYLSQTRAVSSFTTEQEEELLKRVNKDRQIEARTKMAEARFHEDKLKIQQQHDLSVQKILDRKNNELEEMKARYRSKVTEIETRLKKQDKKIVAQARELEGLRQQRSKQINEMKNMEQEKGTTLQNDFEKRLHDKIAEYEQEKFEMQKKHTQEIQEILDETNARIAKMENENNQQTEALNGIVKNLEQELQRLSNECETLKRGKMNLEKDKVELEKRLRTTESERDNLKESVASYEEEKGKLASDYKKKIEQLEKKVKTDVDYEKEEKEKALAQASSTISKLKNEASDLQREIKNTEQRKQNEIQQLAALYRQEKADLEHNFENKVRNLQDELNQVRREDVKKVSDLEALLREKNAELEKSLTMQRQKEQEAEETLAEFKTKMEETSKKIFDDAKIQMTKVEQDLEKSRTSREKQAKEFTRQIENERVRHEKLVSELKISFEQEKTYLIREHQHEKDLLNREHEREKEVYCEKQRGKLQELEAQFRNKSSKDGKVIADLQEVGVSLREQLMQKEALYKQQLVELGMLREEEKQTFKRQAETQGAKYRSDLEQERLQLQRQHSSDMEQVLDKTNSRFKQMEEDYIARSKKMQETMDALREEIQTLKNERITLQNSQEKRLNVTIRKHEEERASLKNHQLAIVKTLEKDIERQKSITKDVEKQARNVELRLQEKISKLQYDYEEKMSNLLPRELKEELEDTIRSLRQQVSILQSRADVLQEELDSTNALSSTWDTSRLDMYPHNKT